MYKGKLSSTSYIRVSMQQHFVRGIAGVQKHSVPGETLVQGREIGLRDRSHCKNS